MLESIFVCPDYDGRDQLPIKQWIKAWSKILLKKVEESGKERDQVIHIIKHMIKMKPEERYDADQCLRKGCENDLFKKRSDGEIVDTDDTTEDEATTGVTDAGTKISTTDQGLGSGERTPTERSAQMTVSATSEAPTVLAGDLWAGDDGGGRKSTGPRSGQPTSTRGTSSGRPARRQKMSHVSDWSWTVGLEGSGSVNNLGLNGEGFWDEAAVPLIRKDHFTASLVRDFAVEYGLQREVEEGDGAGYESPTLPEPDLQIAEPGVSDSFAERLLQQLSA